MFNALRSLFTQDATKAEFRQFLQQYHQRIEAKHGIGHLGLTKCLHAVAEELGYPNYQTLDALSDGPKAAAETGFYRLHFREVPASSDDGGVDKIFRTPELAVGYLWDYVQGRIITNAGGPFLRFLDKESISYGFFENWFDIDGDDVTDLVSKLLLCLSWEDACRVIDWYFDVADDTEVRADYHLTYNESPADEDFRYTNIDVVFESECDHPLLHLAGFSVGKGKVFHGKQMWSITQGPKLSKGLSFSSLSKALALATEDMMALILRQEGITCTADFVALSFKEKRAAAKAAANYA